MFVMASGTKITGLFSSRCLTVPVTEAIMGIDAKAILTEVRSNLSLLGDCEKHSFGTITEYKFGDFNKRLTCNNCGGEMRAGDILKYRKGYTAAGGNPDDVLIIGNG